MQSYTYILIDFLTVIVCFIFSFDPRIKFNRHFGAFLKASTLVAIPFILWDVLFTHMGVWWFDTSYTLGLTIFGLPLEEWLFFFCIPFACVFTYYCLDKFFKFNWTIKFNGIIVWLMILLCLIGVIFFSHKIYPLVTALATISTLIYLHYIAKVSWIAQGSLVYLILMLGFFPVNGILTGTGLSSPVVNYNPDEILNIRMFTIPVEDAIYGYTQFLLNIYFFKLFQNKTDES